MSYYTKTSLLSPKPGSSELSLDGVTEILDEHDISHDVLKDLKTLFASGKASLKVYPGHIDAIMTSISVRQPETRYLVKGQGEDQKSAWTHEYLAGTRTITKAPDKAKAKAKTKATRDALAALEAAGDGQAYSAKTRFNTGDAIEHPTFGKGVVLHAHPDKIVVQFLDAERTLVHAR